jgi:hypothetical protein
MPRSVIGSVGYTPSYRPPTITFPPGATHYWKLNEPVSPSVDEISALDLIWDADIITVPGPLDSAVQFNQSGPAHSLRTHDTPSYRTTGDWTLNLWIKRNPVVTGITTLGQFLTTSAANEDSTYRIEPTLGAGYNEYSNGVAPSGEIVTWPDALFDALWHMLTISNNNAAHVQSFYVDTSIIFTTGIATAGNPSPKPIRLGGFGNNPVPSISECSDFGIWPRQLTPTEIHNLWNGGVPLRP